MPIDTNDAFWLEPLKTGIFNVFGLRIKRIKHKINLRKAYNTLRRQYDSSQILLQIIKERPDDNVKILGIVEVDLYIPVLTFVFGEAQLNGIGAVVSMHRLNNIYYGLPENRELLIRRIIKESIHELGHTFGLIHCSHFGCVMNPSSYVEDIDQKNQELCVRCKNDLVLG